MKKLIFGAMIAVFTSVFAVTAQADGRLDGTMQTQSSAPTLVKALPGGLASQTAIDAVLRIVEAASPAELSLRPDDRMFRERCPYRGPDSPRCWNGKKKKCVPCTARPI